MKSMLPFIFALGTALCWGLYGGVLANARQADGQASPFKPYVGIGVAYLVIAIGGGLVLLYLFGRDYKGNFNFFDGVSFWGFMAGSLGALGALSLTAAMFAGGAKMPQAVMPVVFGGAVTVAALYAIGMPLVKAIVSPNEVTSLHQTPIEGDSDSHEIPKFREPLRLRILSVLMLTIMERPLLWIGIIGMGISAVMIASATPHGHPKKPGAAGKTPASHVDTDASDSH